MIGWVGEGSREGVMEGGSEGRKEWGTDRGM